MSCMRKKTQKITTKRGRDRGDPAPIDYLYQALLKPRKQKYSLGKHARFALALTNVNSKQIDPNWSQFRK